MFWRLLWQLLHASRARLAVALVALVSGAAVSSALLNLHLDAERKLTQEFRSLGANIVVAPRAQGAPIGEPPLADEAVLEPILAGRRGGAVTVAPYLYIVARAGKDQKVIVAGTWLDESRRMTPWWKVRGEWITSRDDLVQCVLGEKAARQLQVAPGDQITLSFGGRTTRLRVAGVASAGGTEDNQIFVNLPVAQRLAGLRGRIGLVQLSVTGPPNELQEFAGHLIRLLPDLEVRPIRQLTDAEGQLLRRIRALIFSTVVVILVLTALCVLATMAALAMERRRDVGLMKALGGSMSRVVRLFLTEAGVLGVLGGGLGYLGGIFLSGWIGRSVFGTAISPRWEVLPLTVALMTGVALAGAFPLRLLGRVRPAEILRGE